MTDAVGNWGNSRPQRHLPTESFAQGGVVQYGLQEMIYTVAGQPRKRNPPHCAPIWRRNLHQRFGWFDCRSYDFCADFEFWLRLAAGRAKFILLDEPKTLFYSAPGTASDRLMHESSKAILERWEPTFPPFGYKETHLGRQHDLLHHCMNMNVVFSKGSYYTHLASEIVTIVVTAHREGELLRNCLATIARQSHALLDVVIVLDHADELTVAVARQFSLSDCRFRILNPLQRIERNYARNLGIALGIGGWICFVDGDDELPADSVACRMEHARKYPESIVCGATELFSGVEVISRNVGARGSYEVEEMRLGQWPHHCSLLIPKAYLERHGLRYPAQAEDAHTPPAEIAGEDVQFMIQLLRASPGQKLLNCGKVVYRYRRHRSSSFRSRHVSMARVVSMLLRNFELREDDVAFKQSLLMRVLSAIHWASAAGDIAGVITSDVRLVLSRASELLTRNRVKQVRSDFIKEFAIIAGHGELDLEALDTSLKECFDRLGLPTELLGAGEAQKAGGSASATGGSHAAELEGQFRRLERFRNCHYGQECLILCNGPSLRKVDFSQIDRARFKVIGLNKIFLGFDLLGVVPDYVVAINRKVIEQSAEPFKALKVTKFVSSRVGSDLVPPDATTYHLNTTNLPAGAKRFSEDIVDYVHEGWTVTHAALQIAYYMGFRAVHIVGMDHRFHQHEAGRENQESTIAGDDVDHFHPAYFGHGQKWDLPDLRNSEISYRAAREAYEADGRQIFDCTVDGACDVFTKRDVSSLHRGALPGPLIGPCVREEEVGVREASVVAELFSCRLPDATLLDVGPGDVSALVPFIDGAWTIFALAADDQKRAVLEGWVTRHPYGGRLTIGAPAGVAAVPPERDAKSKATDGAEARRIDGRLLADTLPEGRLSRVNFLRIEASSDAGRVLQAYPWISSHPDVILCGFDQGADAEEAQSFDIVARTLVDQGYVVYVSEWYPVGEDGRLHWRQLSRYPCELADPRGWGRLLAFGLPFGQATIIRSLKRSMRVRGTLTGKAAEPKPVPRHAVKVVGSGGPVQMLAGPCFRPIDARHWRYEHSEARPRLLLAVFKPSGGATAGREYVGGVTLMAERTMTVDVSVARHGGSSYEGASRRMVLEPGVPRTVRLSKAFRIEHAALKIQLDVLEAPDVESALLRVDDLSLCESFASVQSRLDSESIDLSTANRLFREGDVLGAMHLNLALYKRVPLNLYASNALMAARRLGMGEAHSIDTLEQILMSPPSA